MAKKFGRGDQAAKGRAAAIAFAKAYEDAGVFPICGTLLGMIRGNNVIPHDSDVDFGCLEWPHKVQNGREGFRQVRRFHHKKKTCEIAFRSPQGIKVDLFLFMPSGDNLFFAAWPDEFPGRKTIIRKFPRELFTEWKQLEAFGHSFHSLADPERFLELNYGPNWRKPDPRFDYRRCPQR